MTGYEQRDARLNRELDEHKRELNAIHEIATLALNGADLQHVVDGALDTAMEFGSFDIGLVRLLDPATGVLEPVAHRGYRDPANLASHRRSVKDWRAGATLSHVLTGAESYVIPDLARISPTRMRTLLRERARTVAVVPLCAGEEVLGVLNLATRDPMDLSATHLRVLEAMAGYVGVAVQKSRLVEKLKQQALHDPLTGLANRSLFRDRVAHAMARAARSGSSVTVLFLDLDGFKNINDSLGHDAGDSVLVTTAERLRACIRAGDTAARLGGDEFGILLEGIGRGSDAQGAVARVMAAVGMPSRVCGQSVRVAASVGVATSEAAATPDELVRDADLAMYAAKAEGGGHYAFFDPAMRAALAERAELEADLRAALASHQFVLHFQPVVELATGRCVGFEALLRWRHPRRGLVSPDQFIPLAESTGLINSIGDWAIEEACRQARSWQDACERPMSISVNVSAAQLHDPAFVTTVDRCRRLAGLPPGCLILEITESALVADVPAMVDRLEQLRGVGVRLAIDDFGTGYSSLNYLRAFPLDILKIDKSFIDGAAGGSPQSALVTCLLGVAEALGLEAVAEGIERAEQAQWLTRMNCGYGQGFYYARPLPAEEAGAIVEKTANDTERVAAVRPAS